MSDPTPQQNVPPSPPQPAGLGDKIAATFGLIAGVAGLVLAGCIIYAVVVIFF